MATEGCDTMETCEPATSVIVDPARFRFDEIAYDHFDAIGRLPSGGPA